MLNKSTFLEKGNHMYNLTSLNLETLPQAYNIPWSSKQWSVTIQIPSM